MICTQPDMSYALSVRSIYQSDQCDDHWTTVRISLRYFRRTKDMFSYAVVTNTSCCKVLHRCWFVTHMNDFSISIRLSVYYKVAQWAGRKFYAGFGWVPKLNIVMDTTTKVEYIAALVAAKEGVWVEKFVIELGVVPSEFLLCSSIVYNRGIIIQTEELRSHQKTKLIQSQYNSFENEWCVETQGYANTHTDLNVSDPLRKSFPHAKHTRHRQAIGVKC